MEAKRRVKTRGQKLLLFVLTTYMLAVFTAPYAISFFNYISANHAQAESKLNDDSQSKDFLLELKEIEELTQEGSVSEYFTSSFFIIVSFIHSLDRSAFYNLSTPYAKEFVQVPSSPLFLRNCVLII